MPIATLRAIWDKLRSGTGGLSLPRPMRIIETYGCMANDGPAVEAVVVRRITRNVYNGSKAGATVPFYVVRLSDGREREIPVQDAYRAKDGVLEHRY